MDVHSKETRSYNMSKIRNRDTKPELIVRRFLHGAGFRYRLNVKDLPGKPDIVLPKFRTVVFINGCFWHGHEGCKYYVVPKTRTEWWLAKIEKNKVNDKRAQIELRDLGWKIINIWECQLKKSNRQSTLDSISACLKAS